MMKMIKLTICIDEKDCGEGKLDQYDIDDGEGKLDQYDIDDGDDKFDQYDLDDGDDKVDQYDIDDEMTNMTLMIKMVEILKMKKETCYIDDETTQMIK